MPLDNTPVATWSTKPGARIVASILAESDGA